MYEIIDINLQKLSEAKSIASFILADLNNLNEISFLTSEEKEYIKKKGNSDKSIIVNRLESFFHVFLINSKNKLNIEKERIRKAASIFEKSVSDSKKSDCQIISLLDKDYTIAAIEGLVMSNYKFAKYFKDNEKQKSSLARLFVNCDTISESDIYSIRNVISGVYLARDFVNEPLSSLTAMEFADRIAALSADSNFSVTIRDKEWIEKEKMGGLLAVNKGSVDPPRFVEIEWKHSNPINYNPIILVGKGIVFDTGGISLKTTAFMDYMKSDMGGAAAVVGAMFAIAKNNIPINIKAYLPMTDNRPSGNAYVPGDVIKMHNGLHVEVLNTDAEGRMILADALSYSQRQNPQLVIDIATLTGAASMAVGEHAVVTMGTADDIYFKSLEESGFDVCERVVRFPLWEEYGDAIKSEIADLKNVGGPSAGAITAGKFLEHFINYPWIHLDISGSSFFKSRTNYRGVGGTAFGVRLIYKFVEDLIAKGLVK